MQIFSHFTANEVQLEPFPFKRELSMEAYLIENEGVLSLDQDTFSNVEIVVDELHVTAGRADKDTNGRIDILATYSQEYIAIIELKLGELTCKSLVQLESYLKQKDMISKQYPNILDPSVGTPKWIGVLVGSSIEPGLALKLTNKYVTKDHVPIAALTLQRYRSKNGCIYVTTNTYFKGLDSKNNSKYMYDGKLLGKGKLVLEVLKKHVERNPDLSYGQLEKDFPKSCQGSLGVFATLAEAESIVAETNRARHFLKFGEPIKLLNGFIAVCNQWGIGNINEFITAAEKHGHVIEVLAG